MKEKNILNCILATSFVFVLSGCTLFQQTIRTESKQLPKNYTFTNTQDTTNTAHANWRTYFNDSILTQLIEIALKNNQELNLILQEIEISKNEIKARKGEYLPYIHLNVESSVEKAARYTRNGAVEHSTFIKSETHIPEPLTDIGLSALTTWEVDIWKKLRNAKKAAQLRYLATVQGKNFMVTQLVAEIAEAYYELIALDNWIETIEQNIAIQFNSLKMINQQKEAAKVTQLAVNRFEAQLLNTKNLLYDLKQKRIQTENKINFLLGRFPQPIDRPKVSIWDIDLKPIQAGIPAQLLQNRPDIQQRELELAAAKLDVKIAKANFYPSLRITSSIGSQGFSPELAFRPEGILFGLAGELISPLVNRNVLVANYKTATAKQLQAIIRYEQTVLNAYIEVANQLAQVDNYTQSFQTKQKQVDILTQSIQVANNLFNAARADYVEVLLTQREALEAKIELIEIKLKQIKAFIHLYRALGGGWR